MFTKKSPSVRLRNSGIGKKAIKGFFFLTGRSIIVRLLSFVSLGFLGYYLSEVEFGVFFLVSAVVSFLTYFSDIGLAAALIQKRDRVTNEDLKTTFTIQQTLVIFLVISLFITAPKIVDIYDMPSGALFLLYALGVSFFLASLKTIPSVLMERNLEFNKWILPQFIEDIFYNVFVVYFAWRGFGVASFAWAVLIRAFVGLLTTYILKPWVPGIIISKKSLGKLLRFGVPYQLNTFLAVIKDDGLSILLGGILGVSGVGILGWAQKWAQVPLRLFMDTVTKVSFPAFAKLQGRREELSESVTKSVFFICFLVFPATACMLVFAPKVIDLISKYAKWEGALLPLFLVSINVVFASATTQLTNLLNAIGKIKITFKLMVMWTVLSWLLIPPLSIKFGVNGAALGFGLVGVSSVFAIKIAHRFIPFSLKESVFLPGAAALVMGIIMWGFLLLIPINWFTLGTSFILGLVTYVFATFVFVKKSLFDDVKEVFKEFIKR